jgi:predicted metal-dependent peptidase
MLSQNGKKSGDNGSINSDDGSGKRQRKGKGSSKSPKEGWDDHTKWKEGDDGEDSYEDDLWIARIKNAAEAVEIREAATSCGKTPVFAKRLLKELKKGQIDWRVVLQNFIQEEINDYSFSPPDRRFDDSPFYLPDFNEKDESAKNLLFMIDTSGSMSDEEITDCYSEIYGAIQQFNGKLTGKLGFFDAVVVEPVPFEDEDEFKIIRPKGGGGTSFHIIFDYVREKMQDDPPVSIIILTDGYAPYPDEAAAMDIPVLWIINNKEAQPPSWGKVARMIAEENMTK